MTEEKKKAKAWEDLKEHFKNPPKKEFVLYCTPKMEEAINEAILKELKTFNFTPKYYKKKK